MTTGMNALVISQTRDIHAQIERLLGELAARREAYSKKFSDVMRTGGIKHRRATVMSSIVERKELPPLAADPSRDAAAQSVNRLALEMYGKLRQDEKKNVFFSPYSIASALAMTKAGAAGTSDTILAKLLHLNDEQAASPHASYASLRAAVEDTTQQGGHELRIANHLWSRTGWQVQQPFAETLKTHYAAGMSLLDFGKPKEAADLINAWVRAKTGDKIPSIVRPELFNPQLRLVLGSAIYPFKAELTHRAPFEAVAGNVETPLMHQQDEFGYLEEKDVQILEMVYSPGASSMVILLPRKGGGLHKQEVDVHVPKFKFDTDYDLRPVLETLGAGSLFKAGEAEFSKMTEGETLWLEFLLLRAYVDVNEEGTEAAAVSIGGAAGGLPAPPPVFRADHPFLFLIRDVRTGCILFLGRVVDPSKGA
jgi:serpin B